MKYAFITICTVLSILNWITPLHLGFYFSSEWYTYFTYIFVHANIVHLFLNMFVFWKLWDIIQAKWIFYLSIPLAVGAALLSEKIIPTEGASGVLFAMLGFVYVVKEFTLKAYIKNAVIITLSCVIGYFANVNIALHLWSLIFGITLAAIILAVLITIYNYEL